MIKTIDGLKNIDSDIYQGYLQAITHLHYFLNKSNFKSTAEICFLFMENTESLKSSIFSCADNDDYYTTSVLLRSLNEHFLRFNYFWFNNSPHKDDAYAFKFRTCLDFSERMTVANAVNSAIQIKNGKTKDYDEIFNQVKESSRHFSEFSKGDINEFSKDISVKNIVRHLEKISKKDGFEGNFLPERIIEYAQLSSFVHGGLAAHKEMVDFKVSDNPEKVYLERCSTALLIATSIKVFSYMTLSHCVPEFNKLCYDTTLLMEKIKK